jgi:hypothetical protein
MSNQRRIVTCAAGHRCTVGRAEGLEEAAKEVERIDRVVGPYAFPVLSDIARKIRDLASSDPAPGDQVAEERGAIAAKAREFAAHYPQSSDGRNTFIMLAEWIEARK